MSLVVILVCFGVQRYLQWCSYPYSLSLTEKYYQMLNAKFPVLSSAGYIAKICILVIPVLIVTIIGSAVIHSLLSSVGYFIFCIILFWYMSDYRDLVKSPYDDMSTESILSNRYSQAFVLLFWFAVLGTLGLVLYVMVSELLMIVSKKTSDNQLHGALVWLQGLLDWIPVRLLGLTFSLVGNFSSVFPLWFSSLLAPLTNNREILLQLSQVALKTSGAGDQAAEVSSQSVSELCALLDRSLVVWLVVLLVVTLSGVIS